MAKRIESRLEALEQRQRAQEGSFVFAASFDGGPAYRYEVSEGAPTSEADAIGRGLEVIEPAEHDSDTLIIFNYTSPEPAMK